MSLIGQPTSYSDILKRIFWATLSVGLLCTFLIASVSPQIKFFLESWDTTISIGIFESIKVWYVLLPLVFALLSRVVRLHDKISDVLRLRKYFDINYILIPMAQSVGFPTSGTSWELILGDRKKALSRTFYKYASFINPKIEEQMVRTAADRWAWFWCAIEPQFIILITTIILVFFSAWTWVLITVLSMALLTSISFLIWPSLRKGAVRQVEEIMENDQWRAEVQSAFIKLSRP